ncbi:MAG TPA: hypothetical protein VFD56_10010, partial [Chitinophagaceae bacterium]|nr:hypothetical protein [Chitinophagaceae bacterium]
RQELNKLEVDKGYYIHQIEENKESIFELMSDPANLEKFAREKYHMKKDNEDVFLIIRPDENAAIAAVEEEEVEEGS